MYNDRVLSNNNIMLLNFILAICVLAFVTAFCFVSGWTVRFTKRRNEQREKHRRLEQAFCDVIQHIGRPEHYSEQEIEDQREIQRACTGFYNI